MSILISADSRIIVVRDRGLKAAALGMVYDAPPFECGTVRSDVHPHLR